MSHHTTVSPQKDCRTDASPAGICQSVFQQAARLMSWLLLGLVLQVAFPCEAQTVTVSGYIPYSDMLLGPEGKLNVWSMSDVRVDKDYTVNPGGNSIMEKDSRSRSWNLGYQSKEVEPTKEVKTKPFKGTLDMTGATLPAIIAILVDDKATLTIEEDVNARPAGVTGPAFTQTYTVDGTALWNPKSYKEFIESDKLIPAGRKYTLTLNYANTANLTKQYHGKTDVDGVSVYVCLLLVELAVDANRDGTIAQGEHASQEKPFRFWINNDYDHYSEDEGTSGMKNSETDEIDGIRDLEDFVQIRLTLPSSIVDLAKQKKAEVGFCWTDATGSPSARLFPIPTLTGRSYLSNFSAAITLTSDQGGSENATSIGSETPAALPSEMPFGWVAAPNLWFDKINSGGELHLLMEGKTRGKGKLTASIKLNGQWINATGIYIHLMDIKEMFQRGKAYLNNRTDPDGIPDPWVNQTPGHMSWTVDDLGSPFQQDPDEAKESVVFVHGWRMTEEESESYAETSFKRLWQIGYKGRFAAFRWPTYSGPFGGYFTYNPSEYRAWLSGPALAAYVNQLPYQDARHIFSHSMGAVVTGAALRADMKVSHYAMLHAAMAAMAYDGNIVDYPQYVTPDGPNETDPVTVALGLKDKFNLNGTVFANFFLPADSALGAWRTNNAIFKPQIETLFAAKYEFISTYPAGKKLICEYGQWRYVTDLPEAMGYVTRSRSIAAGSSADTNGCISSANKVNLSAADYGFGDMHSAEFVKPIQKTYAFWRQVMRKLGLKPTDN